MVEPRRIELLTSLLVQGGALSQLSYRPIDFHGGVCGRFEPADLTAYQEAL